VSRKTSCLWSESSGSRDRKEGRGEIEEEEEGVVGSVLDGVLLRFDLMIVTLSHGAL
jgi:hypothetical protein